MDLGNSTVIAERRLSGSGAMEIPRVHSRVLLTSTHRARLRDSQDTPRSHLRGTGLPRMSPIVPKSEKCTAW